MMNTVSLVRLRFGLLALIPSLLFAACSSEGGDGPLGLMVKVCGPPLEPWGLDDPFADCYFLKVCYKLKGETKLRECQLIDFIGGEADLSSIPWDKEVSVVAECYDHDKTAAKPVPRNLLSKGQTVPARRRSGDPLAGSVLYMLKPSSFGPTLSFGDDATCAAQATKPFNDRWGATATELYDSTVLIAGGVSKLKSGCEDWSLPECVESGASSAEIFNPRDGTFTLVGTDGGSLMSSKRAFAAAVRLPSEEIAIFGGINAKGEPTNSVDIYDPVGLTFRPGPPMNETRAYHTATLVLSTQPGFVLLVGGLGTGENNWEIWRADQESAVASGQLHEARWHHTASFISKAEDPAIKRNMVLVAGGEAGKPGSASVRNTVEIFDIDANTLDPYPRSLCSNDGENSPAAAKKTMHAAALVPKRHFLYIAGGFSDGKHISPVKDICVWHTTQEKWSGEAGTFQLKDGRGALTATALPGNVVLFAGGLNKSGGPADTVEIVFEYVNDKGETVVDIGPGKDYPIPMLEPRWNHLAAPTADGKVLIVGGLSGKAATAQPQGDAELFNLQ